MAMSATAAAKRRRAGGVLSSPMLQPPHVLQSMSTNRLISTLQNIQQASIDTEQSNAQSVPQNSSTTNNLSNFSNVDHGKGLTLQQVITLLDGRLINLEKNIQPVVSENIENIPINMDFQLKIEESVSQSETRIQESFSSVIEDKISRRVEDIRSEILQSAEEIILNQMGEFNHRYEILATEILNLKTLILELQSYTMGVNKMLLEERINVFSELTSNQFKTTNDEVKLESEVVSLNDNIEIEPEANNEVEPQAEPEVEPQVEPRVEPEVEPQVEPEVEPQVEPEVEPDVEPEVETQVEPEVVPHIEAEVEPQVEPEVEPQVEPEVEPRVEPEVEPQVEPEVEPQVEPEVEPQVEPQAETRVESNVIVEKKPETFYQILTQKPVITEAEKSDFVLVSSKSKKGKAGKNQKKKNSMNVEQEVSVSI